MPGFFSLCFKPFLDTLNLSLLSSIFAGAQPLSRVWLSAIAWTAACQASLSFTISWSLLKRMSIELVMTYNHLVLCSLLLLLPSIFPSIRVFSNDSPLRIRWPKYWASLSASVLPMNTQGWLLLGLTALISLLSMRLSKVFSNITIRKHQFFGAQPSLGSNSHPYITTGKTKALTTQTFVGKVMSLLFNRLVIAFLPRSKRLLISWLQSPSTVICGAQ